MLQLGTWIWRRPDAFPDDASAYLDTDSDGLPDELFGNSTTGLVEDFDDDGDQSGLPEIENGTDPKDPLKFLPMTMILMVGQITRDVREPIRMM